MNKNKKIELIIFLKIFSKLIHNNNYLIIAVINGTLVEIQIRVDCVFDTEKKFQKMFKYFSCTAFIIMIDQNIFKDRV